MLCLRIQQPNNDRKKFVRGSENNLPNYLTPHEPKLNPTILQKTKQVAGIRAPIDGAPSPTHRDL